MSAAAMRKPEMVAPYLTTAEAAAYLRYEHPDALLQQYRRGRIMPAGGRGKSLLWTRSELDRFVREGLRTHEQRETANGDQADGVGAVPGEGGADRPEDGQEGLSQEADEQPRRRGPRPAGSGQRNRRRPPRPADGNDRWGIRSLLAGAQDPVARK